MKKIVETQDEITLESPVFCNACNAKLSAFEVDTLRRYSEHENAGLCSDCSVGNPDEKYGSKIIDKNIKRTSQGGARPGAGRPKVKNKKQVKSFTMSGEAFVKLLQIADKKDASMSAALESIIMEYSN